MAFAHELLRKGNKAAKEGNDRAKGGCYGYPMANAILSEEVKRWAAAVFPHY